jgi:hypothetical protein
MCSSEGRVTRGAHHHPGTAGTAKPATSSAVVENISGRYSMSGADLVVSRKRVCCSVIRLTWLMLILFSRGTASGVCSPGVASTEESLRGASGFCYTVFAAPSICLTLSFHLRISMMIYIPHHIHTATSAILVFSLHNAILYIHSSMRSEKFRPRPFVHLVLTS